MVRVTKKQQYINALTHNIEWFTATIDKGERFAWHFGTQRPLSWWIREVNECRTELEKVLSDKSYKPWKEVPELY